MWWVSAIPWLVPGCVLALIVGTLASGRVATWLGCRRWVAWVIIVSFGVILAGTVTPVAADPRRILQPAGVCDMSRIGLAPLTDLRWPSDVLGNILGFIPLGVAIALVPGSRRRTGVLVVALALPFAIEATQLLVIPLGRACQGADVVDNLTGLVIGLVVGAVLGRLRPALRRVPAAEG